MAEPTAPPPGFVAIPPPPEGFSAIPPAPEGFVAVQDNGWTPTPFGFRVKDVTDHLGRPAKQREDGSVWYPDPNRQEGGAWFNAQGQQQPYTLGGMSATQRVLNVPLLPGTNDPNMGPGQTFQAAVARQTKTPWTPNVTLGRMGQGIINMGLEAGRGVAHLLDATSPGSIPGGYGSAVPSMEAFATAERAAADKYLTPGAAGEVAGQILPSLVMPATAAPGATTTAARAGSVALGGLEGALYGALGTNAPAGGTVTDFWKSKLKSGGIGALFGTIMKAVPEGIDVWASKFRNPEAQKAITALKVTDAMAGRAPGPKLSQGPAAIIEQTRPQPEAVVTATKAAENLQTSLTNDMNKLPFDLGGLQQVAAGTGKHSGLAKDVLARAQRSLSEGEITSASVAVELAKRKVELERMAQTRAEMMKGITVAPDKPVAILDDWLNDLIGPDASKWPGKPTLVKKLQDIRESLLATSKEVPTKLLDEQGNIITRTVQTPNTAASFGKTRSDVGDEISTYYAGANAELGKKGVNYLQSFKQAISQAQSDAAIASGKPGLIALDAKFNKMYSNFAEMSRDPLVIDILQNPEPTKIMAKLARLGPEQAKTVMGLLDSKGQAAYATGLINETLRDAVYARTGGAPIPGNITMKMGKVNQALTQVIRDPATKIQVDSLMTTLQGLARSHPEQASALGQRLTGSAEEAIARSSGLGNALVSLGKAVRDGGVDFFFNTPSGRDFLFQARGLKANSPKLMRLLEARTPRILHEIETAKAINSLQEQK